MIKIGVTAFYIGLGLSLVLPGAYTDYSGALIIFGFCLIIFTVLQETNCD